MSMRNIKATKEEVRECLRNAVARIISENKTNIKK